MTTLSLSARQQRQLTHTMRVLLTCAEHESIDAWRLEVNRASVDLTGADKALFAIFGTTAPVSVSDELPAPEEYQRLTAALDARLRLWDRQVALTTWTRVELWGRYLPEMKRSAYFHEFIRPNRCYDTIGLTVAAPDRSWLGSIHLTHDDEVGSPFGRKGLALLRMLEPGLRAGLELAFRQFAAVSPMQRGVPILSSGAPATTRARALTRREAEVAALLVANRSNREIGEILGVSPGTAKRHVENILGKLGLESRKALARVVEG